MASPISTLSICSSSYVRKSMPSMYSLTSCSCSSYSSHTSIKALNFHLSSRFSQIGLCHLTPWNGLRHMGISISPRYPKLGSRGKCKGKVVYASLFGVGAPEALVIGAVALLVFGPKGLAEVARNLGKTLRAFQPTIRELQEVSREFKNTLEKEIGVDDDLDSVRNTYQSSTPNTSSQAASTFEDPQSVSVADPNGAPPNNAYSSEEFLKITEEQLKASGSAQQDAASAPPDSQAEIESQPQGSDPANNAYSSEEYLKVTEEQLKAAAVKQQDVASLPQESEIEVGSQPQGGFQETAIAEPSVPQKPESEA